MATHKGGCHCGKIHFEFDAPSRIEATRCNCSICRMTGFLHYFVRRDDFRLQSDEGDLATYTFNTGVAKHLFCRRCGIKSFYVPRSHPDSYSINLNCVDPRSIESISTAEFDGRNWEQNIGDLSPSND